jgi:hypothetical protein
MRANVEWRGDQVSDEIARRLKGALDKINLRIEAKAKGELVPGHGRLYGTLYRSIHTQPARREGDKIRGAIGSNVIYARRIHHLYFYFYIAVNAVKPQVLNIVRQHTRD